MLHEVRFSRMRLLVGAFLLLLPLMVTREAFTQIGGTVNGRVEGLRGEPKQFVSVSLEGPGRYVATTNASGVFEIRKVTPGYYTIHVRQGDRVAVFTRDIGSGHIDLVVNW